jgi:CCR4-NOT transcriptional complex subunit CAF120
MSEHGNQELHNVLSVSTAANNRYLFHFSSLNSLTQWTAGIRLAMFEHSSLQESYTGSLIAGKGKNLNNIRQIMDRNRIKYEDWARVRFGAGTPWRRCWFVVSPPDEKEYLKAQKAAKKRSPYEKNPILRGELKFYETKKITKKTKPIATITDAFSAYAIYPQSKPLIDQSTLVKIEGKITIHSSPESSTDGMVFVMPESHPAVSGFEMLLRFLFPVWDTFALYGRPSRLIADVRDTRGLMFALPQDRKYGYLEILDVSGLIHTDGRDMWTEREWRKNMKDLTAKRMLTLDDHSEPALAGSKVNMSRTSLPPSRSGRLRFDETASGRSTPSATPEYRTHRRAETAGLAPSDPAAHLRHRRSASEAILKPNNPHRLSQSQDAYGDESPPAPPAHAYGNGQPMLDEKIDKFETASESSGKSSGEKTPERTIPPEIEAFGQKSPPPGPVGIPPIMAHAPSQKPDPRPIPPAELRRGHSDLDPATLNQIEEVSSPVSQHHEPQFNGSQGPYPPPSASYGERSWQPPQTHGQQVRNPPTTYVSRNPYGPPRLATIPASPFVEQGASPNSSHTATSYFNGPVSQGQPLPTRPVPPPHSSSGLLRRPVGARQSPTKSDYDDSRPPTSTSSGSTSGYFSAGASPVKEDLPDRPRMGKMKTVGETSNTPNDIVIGDAHYSPGLPNDRPSDIPNVNFGPTYALNPAAKFGPPLGHARGNSASSQEFLNRSNPQSQPSPPAHQYPQQQYGHNMASAAAAAATTNAYQRSGQQGPYPNAPRGPPLGHGQNSPPGPRPAPNPVGGTNPALSFESTRAHGGQSGRTTPGSGGPRLVPYGGQWLPEQQAHQARNRDLQFYGPQYVESRERMAPAMRNPATPPGSSGGVSQGQVSPQRHW